MYTSEFVNMSQRLYGRCQEPLPQVVMLQLALRIAMISCVLPAGVPHHAHAARVCGALLRRRRLRVFRLGRHERPRMEGDPLQLTLPAVLLTPGLEETYGAGCCDYPCGCSPLLVCVARRHALAQASAQQGTLLLCQKTAAGKCCWVPCLICPA